MKFLGTLTYSGSTDTGRVRQHNEDAIAILGELGCFLLADGMGGRNAGEVASNTTIDVISQAVTESFGDVTAIHTDSRGVFSPESGLLESAVSQANSRVHVLAESKEECKGMGTTLVAALFHGSVISIAHVGDSRLYRLRDGEFAQLTVDHSYVQEMLDRKLYTPEEARRSRNKNIITRAIGVDSAVQVDILEEPVLAGDCYLLCSDGLSGMVDDSRIQHILNENDDLNAAANSLIEEANKNGGTDNISVILVNVTELEESAGDSDEDLDWFD